jgi:hypothetical protein
VAASGDLDIEVVEGDGGPTGRARQARHVAHDGVAIGRPRRLFRDLGDEILGQPLAEPAGAREAGHLGLAGRNRDEDGQLLRCATDLAGIRRKEPPRQGGERNHDRRGTDAARQARHGSV